MSILILAVALVGQWSYDIAATDSRHRVKAAPAVAVAPAVPAAPLAPIAPTPEPTPLPLDTSIRYLPDYDGDPRPFKAYDATGQPWESRDAVHLARVLNDRNAGRPTRWDAAIAGAK